MLMFLALALFINLTLLTASHPVMIMILVITQTLLICVMTWLLTSTAWLSFILFLIFIGGLMVLFIYITSLAANEKMGLSFYMTKKQAIMLMYIYMFLALVTFFYPIKLLTPTPLSGQIEMIFSQMLTPLTLIIMIYLLITLIVAVKISKKMEGPIRNMMKTK